MFRPSPGLCFRPMPALNKLKIHQPLPLSPRESKQLLNLLTSSFRQQLDTEHGEFRTDATTTYPAVRRPSRSENFRPRRRSISESWRNPTDRHMHSLLTNPLFSMSVNGIISKSIRDPMDLFDQAVAKGMMNLEYARACLNAKKRDIVQSSVPNIRDGMKDSGAGFKALKWLISSGTANNLDFLKNEQFSGILMEYMVAEGLQEAAWTWIKKAFEDLPDVLTLSGTAWKASRRDVVRPLMLLIKAEAAGPAGLDNAYICLSRAAGYLKGMTSMELRTVLGPPGWFLAHETTMSYPEHRPSTESSFESFLGLVPVISKHVNYYFAHLNLIHPTKPNAELALAYLRAMDKPGNGMSETQRKVSEEHSQARRHIQLCLDTAKFLLERDRYFEAEWVMDLLRSNYPEQLGLQQKRQLDQAKAEASSLELLESLSFA